MTFRSTGPTVLVANHINGLVDALLLMATPPRFPRFLGKSTLFRISPLWPFLKLDGVVPVFRAADGESTVRAHRSAVDDAAHAVLTPGRRCRRRIPHRPLWDSVPA